MQRANEEPAPQDVSSSPSSVLASLFLALSPTVVLGETGLGLSRAAMVDRSQLMREHVAHVIMQADDPLKSGLDNEPADDDQPAMDDESVRARVKKYILDKDEIEEPPKKESNMKSILDTLTEVFAKFDEPGRPNYDYTNDFLSGIGLDDDDDRSFPKNFDILNETLEKKPDGSTKKWQKRSDIQKAGVPFKIHEDDVGSPQFQIARLTARIAYLTRHMIKNTHDYACLRGLSAVVTQRRKLLQYLYRYDSDEFFKICAALRIKFRPILEAGTRTRADYREENSPYRNLVNPYWDENTSKGKLEQEKRAKEEEKEEEAEEEVSA